MKYYKIPYGHVLIDHGWDHLEDLDPMLKKLVQKKILTKSGRLNFREVKRKAVLRPASAKKQQTKGSK